MKVYYDNELKPFPSATSSLEKPLEYDPTGNVHSNGVQHCYDCCIFRMGPLQTLQEEKAKKGGF